MKFEYDSYGRLGGLVNENGERYRFGYDARDRLVEQEDLDGLPLNLHPPTIAAHRPRA